MPTPVGTARQCLTEDAARALDDAVAVARRRSHAQTTSLHAVSALLSLPSSSLREACSRAASGACAPRLQFRALDLSVGVSLDRLPTSRSQAAADEDGPPVSNSLMAAIRRSQANQRRQPESFYVYNQTASVLKVELKHFTLSILDDPIVSRVFGEAGFRSCDIKFAILNPPVSPCGRVPTRAPMFLCNLPGYDVDNPGFRFGFGAEVRGQEDGDENFRRIANVLLGKGGKRKNPLLVGVSSRAAVNKFVSVINGSSSSNSREVLLGELVGLTVVSLEDVVVGDKESMRLKFEEIRGQLEGGAGRGLIVNYGELKGFVGANLLDDDDDDDDGVTSLVSQLKGLVEKYQHKVWLIGAAASEETLSRLVKRFPAIEKDLDLHILPVASSTSSFVCSPGSQSSLMKSFVPFGGFFSTPDDLRSPSGVNPSVPRCNLCTAKCEQEVAPLTSAESKVSVADQCSGNISSWLRMADVEPSNKINLAQTADDRGTMNAKNLGLERKWNDICQHLHHTQQFSISEASQVVSPVKVVQGNGFTKEKGKTGWITDSSPARHQCQNLTPAVVTDSTFQPKHTRPLQVVSRGEDTSCQSKALDNTSNSQLKGDSNPVGLQVSPVSCRMSPSGVSGTSKATCEFIYAPSSLEASSLKRFDHVHHSQHISPSNSVTSDTIGERTSHRIGESDSCSGLSLAEQFDMSLYKTIMRALAERVGWQDEAICKISEAVSRCRTKYKHGGTGTRRDIWLNFHGPDRVGKKRMASTLAEIIIGSSERLVSVDLSFHDKDSPSTLIFECQEWSDYHAKFRGKTLVDHIAAEARKSLRAVIFIESIDKADLLVQSSLSQAVRLGKLPDSCGREININNMLFVTTTSNVVVQKEHLFTDQTGNKYSEEEVLAARRWQMNLSVELLVDDADPHDTANVRVTRDLKSSKTSSNKRKRDGTLEETKADASKRSQPAPIAHFDLNLPAEEMEENISHGDSYCDSVSENTEAWLEDFLDQVDERVMFKPFDLDALAEETTKLIATRFQDEFGSTGLLEITHQAMVQMVAASWSSGSGKAIEEWVGKVLARGFMEARHKCRLHHHHGGRVLVTLAACQGLVMEQQADGICLPSKINLQIN